MNNLKKRLISHSLLLTTSVLIAYVWTSSQFLSDYNLQFIAFLIVGYFLTRLFLRKGDRVNAKTISSLDMTILTLIIFILVFSTGALSSPLFFLLYFLLFGLSLLFEPGSSLFMVFISSFIFLLIPEKKDLFAELLQLASLFMIVPLALIFGKQYIKLMQSELEVKSLTTEEKIFTKKIEVQQRQLTEIQQYLKSLENDPGTSEENKNLLRRILQSIFVLAFFFFTATGVKAQAVIESPNYRIQFPNLNSGAGIPSSTNYSLDTTIGQTGAGQFSSAGYIVKSGFQYIHSIIPFSFSISKIAIPFGTLTPQTPSTDTSTLTVSAGGAGGYQVTAKENNPLQNQSLDTIIDTLCDAGTCSETTAGVWSQNTTYGFGYNMSGNDVPAAFVDSTYFKQFADASAAESAKVVMSSANVGRARQSTITYKVNISNVQAAGTYKNTITFTATPTY